MSLPLTLLLVSNHFLKEITVPHFLFMHVLRFIPTEQTENKSLFYKLLLSRHL